MGGVVGEHDCMSICVETCRVMWADDGEFVDALRTGGERRASRNRLVHRSQFGSFFISAPCSIDWPRDVTSFVAADSSTRHGASKRASQVLSLLS